MSTPICTYLWLNIWRLERRTATNIFPTPPTTSSLSKAITIAAGQTFTPPQAYTRYDRGSGACKGQTEGGDSDAVFLLEEGATLSRVVIGANQAEGVHCLGMLDFLLWFCQTGTKGDSSQVLVPWTTCISRWELIYRDEDPSYSKIIQDVCEDAITIKQTSGTSRINYGGVSTNLVFYILSDLYMNRPRYASDYTSIVELFSTQAWVQHAEDKIVQHNGGGTVRSSYFWMIPDPYRSPDRSSLILWAFTVLSPQSKDWHTSSSTQKISENSTAV